MEPPVIMTPQQQKIPNHSPQIDLSQNLQISTLKSDFYSMELRDFSSSPSISPISKSPLLSPTIPGRIVPELSDEELAQLSVRQLNMKLQGHDRKTVSVLKQKRRTLKNRGYALNCRVRRIKNQIQLEADNIALKEQVNYLTDVLHQLNERLQYYEQPHTFLLPLTPPTMSTGAASPTSAHSSSSSGSPSSSSSSYFYNTLPQGFASH